MNPGDVAPLIISITAIVTTAAVILLFPLSRKLGSFLEAATTERLRRPAEEAPGTAALRNEVVALHSKILDLEDRLRFTESLLDSAQRRELTGTPQGVSRTDR